MRTTTIYCAIGDIHGELERQINVLEEKMAHEGRMMNGRQITWLLYKHFRVSETEGPS